MPAPSPHGWTSGPTAARVRHGLGARAGAVGRIESLLEIITRAHLLVYAEHRRLVDAGLQSHATRGLLSESVRIVLERAPEAARPARAIAQERALRQLLEAEGEIDDAALDEAIRRAEEILTTLLRRQQDIVNELTERRRGDPEQ